MSLASRTVTSRQIRLVALLASTLAPALAITAPSSAAADEVLTPLTAITIPGAPLNSFDISYVDPSIGIYVLGDRSHKAVDVVDTHSNQLIMQIGAGLFTGATGNNDTSGPDGVLVIPGDTVAWVGDSPGLIKAVDLKSGAVVASISNGGKNRADELTYDPKNHLIVIANNADEPPFITFISTTSRKAVGKIVYSNAGGLEQPAFDPESGMFFQNVVSSKENPGGAVDKIDPKTMKVVATYPVPECKPAGLALGPQHQLAVGCSGDAIDDGAHAQTIILDATDGHIVAKITEVGGSDEVWYNPGDNRYYTASRSMTSNGMKDGKSTPVVGVIDAGTNKWITNIPSGKNAHSVAVDPSNNHVFVPVPNGIAVFGQ